MVEEIKIYKIAEQQIFLCNLFPYLFISRPVYCYCRGCVCVENWTHFSLSSVEWEAWYWLPFSIPITVLGAENMGECFLKESLGDCSINWFEKDGYCLVMSDFLKQTVVSEYLCCWDTVMAIYMCRRKSTKEARLSKSLSLGWVWGLDSFMVCVPTVHCSHPALQALLVWLPQWLLSSPYVIILINSHLDNEHGSNI